MKNVKLREMRNNGVWLTLEKLRVQMEIAKVIQFFKNLGSFEDIKTYWYLFMLTLSWFPKPFTAILCYVISITYAPFNFYKNNL